MHTIKSRSDADAANPVAECVEAKHIISMLEEAIDELRGMETFITLLCDVTAGKVYSHRKVSKLLKRIKSHTHDDMIAVYKLRGIYRNLVADYEHIVGQVEVKRCPNFADLSASLESILGEDNRARLKRDLLDGRE